MLKDNIALSSPQKGSDSVISKSFSLLNDLDISLFKSGKHFKLYEKLGAHVVNFEGIEGIYFAVWAPNAKKISVKFIGLKSSTYPMKKRSDDSGIWEIFIPEIIRGIRYNYLISSQKGQILEKSDPFSFKWEQQPSICSTVWDTAYSWQDNSWMENRKEHNGLNKPMSVYEMHFGSWSRSLESPYEFLTYRQMSEILIPYLKETGFTHVEFLPLMEHPYYPSWGYQITGYFAATNRYGTPQDLMFLIEQLHLNGIGVILDWVPSHFPGDEHGLFRFDGSHLFEHDDFKKGFHPDWKSYIFNYGKSEVKSFLISNAHFWMECFHVDCLRVDAVASMLYLDYSRKEGEWLPNINGGKENLEAISFIQDLNQSLYTHFPDIQTIAEESTAFPGVTRPVHLGGLGFGMKWMMGWMHDTLEYFGKDPVHRKFEHQGITFSTYYAFTENFMLTFSHDEVVHEKGSLLNRMPGDEWQKFANLRLLYLYMFTHPGTKCLFMGNEIGQVDEWDFNKSIDWHLLEHAKHQGVKRVVTALNLLYKSEPALYEKSFDESGFEWVEGSDADNSILAYLRKGFNPEDDILVILNLTPVPRNSWRVGLPFKGKWKLLLNSDEEQFYGAGLFNDTEFLSEEKAWHGRKYSTLVNLPPLAGLVFKRPISENIS
ncbi:1,4-alpha-glucan branching protein GlgB [Daejeonella sp.]|jgi:1,4-alpha-glucan branching enzyme|uniref:1,4-alpha-glucan branching protein GlgB n=1 Tax=Daejeonella sp. TaxID=2805397 RepID=UPI0037C13E58